MTDNRLTIIDWLLSHPISTDKKPPPSIKAWKSRHDKDIRPWSETADRAIAGGFLADRVAYAFASGYHSALQNLVPTLPAGAFPALCITEKGGGHPRMIESRLTRIDQHTGDQSLWRLNGRKQFITGAAEADLYLVAASTGTGDDGKNNIRLVRIDAGTPGVTVELMPDLPFIPEISHGVLWLKDVAVQDTQFLPEDGYTAYIKPFRTIEDLHVSAAVLGYCFRVAAQFNWPAEQREQILGLIVAMRTLAVSDPAEPGGHIALGGALQLMDRLMLSLAPFWERVDPDVREAWDRDKALMGIAGKVRSRRLETAWAHYQHLSSRP